MASEAIIDEDTVTVPQYISSQTSLIERASGRDLVAWKSLIQLYSPMVYEWAREAGASPADACKITQKAFRIAWDNLRRFTDLPPHASFRHWLSSVVLKTAMSGTASGKWKLTELAEKDTERLQPSDRNSARTVKLAKNMFSQLPHRALTLVRSEVDEKSWKTFCRVAVLNESETAVAKSFKLSPADVRQAKYRVLYRLHLLLLDR